MGQALHLQMMASPNPYDVLGVNRNASDGEIKREISEGTRVGDSVSYRQRRCGLFAVTVSVMRQ